MDNQFSINIIINASTQKVWSVLTNQQLMPKWLGEPEMNILVLTNWQVNSPIFIKGFHHVNFENKGIVLQYKKDCVLKYSHLSSISKLEDKPENYTILEFVLSSINNQTKLTININNFPTETIQKHLEFYWRTAIFRIKQNAEVLN